jgi:hypothetical protein
LKKDAKRAKILVKNFARKILKEVVIKVNIEFTNEPKR